MLSEYCELPDELINTLRCALTDCSSRICNTDSFWDTIVEKALDKSKKTIPLSIAGALAASLVSYGFHKFNKAYLKDKQSPPSPREDWQDKISRTASLSAVGAAAGFTSRVGINMITGGSDLPINLGSKIISEVAAKKVTTYLPQYTGKNKQTWKHTIAKASASAIVGTLSYSLAHDYLQLPSIASRIISAGSSAMTEQVFQYTMK
tara:strand:- start:31246 stop:31863 length:618 start_codon:yes stop_codon:yes gene_type:complete